jgi:hypothetical protein
MNAIRTLILFLISNLLVSVGTLAQALPDTTISKINKLFTLWDKRIVQVVR